MSRPVASLQAVWQVLLDDYPVDLCWSPDGRYVVLAGGEGRLYRVSAADAGVVQLGSHEPGLLAAAWQPGGKWLATSGQDGSVQLWDGPGAGGQTGRVIHRGLRWPLALAFEPKGKSLAFVMGRELHRYSSDGEPLPSIGPHDVPLTQLTWRNATQCVVAGGGQLCLDTVGAAQPIETHLLDGAPLTLCISPDARIAAAGLQDGQLNFRYLATHKRSRMSGYDGKVDQTSWSANSRWLATAASGSGDIVVWDFSGKGPEGTEPLQLRTHAERIEALAFAPEGAWLVSGGRDWRLVLWRPGPSQRADVEAPLDVQLLDAPIGRISWSRDGKRVAVAQTDGRLRLFTLQA